VAFQPLADRRKRLAVDVQVFGGVFKVGEC
jgi:hypothetical protein